ncbi:hypothetical protein DSO57_1002012 [Entomophthora muscae]|nr:hypothetical protein DSO57_1002012 [Entomophthora muscae]
MHNLKLLLMFGLASRTSGHHKYRLEEAGNEVKFTYYWIAVESEFPVKSYKPTTELRSCRTGSTIKIVSTQYFSRVKMEGSGILTTGQFVNCADDQCDCFEIVEGGAKGSNNNSLIPYTSVAANGLEFGMKLFVKELNGTILPPANLTHNGCVRVDDRSWSFGLNQIDWFVFDKRYYKSLDSVLKLEKVTINTNSDCQLLNYTQGLLSSKKKRKFCAIFGTTDLTRF